MVITGDRLLHALAHCQEADHGGPEYYLEEQKDVESLSVQEERGQGTLSLLAEALDAKKQAGLHPIR